MKRVARIILGTVAGMALPGLLPTASAAVSKQLPATAQEALVPLYKQAAETYDVPWTLLAAIDRYAELTKTKAMREEAPYYGLGIESSAWSGIENPIQPDISPLRIKVFHGMGLDGNGDALALPWDEADRIPALANWFDTVAGSDGDSEGFEEGVWTLFQDSIAMDRVFSFEKIFDAFGLNPTGHCFPIAKRYNYTVKHTFGAGRSYGGRRIHEGVDIFANYGTPALACSYGYVELMGWNRFGGWRVGIRDANNVYYYYAHLSSFAKGLHQGDLVRPGEVIGYVGSTGYGPPGTAGKFPPHLHFGMYKHSGTREWAYSPSAALNQWQRLPQKITTPSDSD